MTAARLNEILGNHIEVINSHGNDRNQRQDAIQQAEVIVKLARQHINNSQVLLRADKMLKATFARTRYKRLLGINDEEGNPGRDRKERQMLCESLVRRQVEAKAALYMGEALWRDPG